MLLGQGNPALGSPRALEQAPSKAMAGILSGNMPGKHSPSMRAVARWGSPLGTAPVKLPVISPRGGGTIELAVGSKGQGRTGGRT